MASFTVDFQANTTGDHNICYREVGSGDPYTCETVNVTATGPNSLTIQLSLNLYCQDIELEGYIIAACQDQTDADLDGVPDLAITFIVPILTQVADPCPLWSITCNSVGISAIGVGGGSAGYTTGTYTVPTTGGIAITPGSVEITVSAGGVIQLFTTILDPGEYTAAPTGLDLSSVPNGGAPTPPSGYTVDMLPCTTLDLTTLACNSCLPGEAQPTNIQLELGDSVELCADETAIAGLASEFVTREEAQPSGGGCHCIDCNGLYVRNELDKTVAVYYQTCWEDGAICYDGEQVVSIVSEPDTWQYIACVIPDTVVLDLLGSADPTNLVETAFGPCDGSGPILP